MNFDKIEVDIDPDYTMMKKVKDKLFLSQEQMDILKEFNVDYMQYSNLRELILALEELYESSGDEVINNLLDILSERDYYENYNK
ncbi:MAG: hypothetical protein K2G03_01660 [Bacilli bacterium]|nr:hypothetical protein [Bacilli bacterium]MDE6141289.1 hypothetical protein [Bacilli bacterium]